MGFLIVARDLADRSRAEFAGRLNRKGTATQRGVSGFYAWPLRDYSSRSPRSSGILNSETSYRSFLSSARLRHHPYLLVNIFINVLMRPDYYVALRSSYLAR